MYMMPCPIWKWASTGKENRTALKLTFPCSCMTCIPSFTCRALFYFLFLFLFSLFVNVFVFLHYIFLQILSLILSHKMYYFPIFIILFSGPPMLKPVLFCLPNIVPNIALHEDAIRPLRPNHENILINTTALMLSFLWELPLLISPFHSLHLLHSPLKHSLYFCIFYYLYSYF